MTRRWLVAVSALLLVCSPPAKAEHGWELFASYRDAKDASDAPGVGLSLSYEILPGALLDFRLVGGVEYTLSRNVEAIQATRGTVFAEVMSRNVEADRINTGGGTALPVQDGDLSGLGANLGLKLRW